MNNSIYDIVAKNVKQIFDEENISVIVTYETKLDRTSGIDSLNLLKLTLRIEEDLGINLDDYLNLIRKIRNTFAHNIFQSSFEMDEIENQVSRLYFISHSLFEEWIETASIKDKFVLDSVIIIVALVKKIVRKDSFGECIDEIDDLGFEEIDWEYLNSEIEK